MRRALLVRDVVAFQKDPGHGRLTSTDVSIIQPHAVQTCKPTFPDERPLDRPDLVALHDERIVLRSRHIDITLRGSASPEGSMAENLRYKGVVGSICWRIAAAAW